MARKWPNIITGHAIKTTVKRQEKQLWPNDIDSQLLCTLLKSRMRKPSNDFRNVFLRLVSHNSVAVSQSAAIFLQVKIMLTASSQQQFVLYYIVTLHRCCAMSNLSNVNNRRMCRIWNNLPCTFLAPSNSRVVLEADIILQIARSRVIICFIS